ncbi:MAG: ABC transporter ATP-binding protein, partial [Paludibacteraceae bacterium]|nr:ABC transporter ATP-binding protein [Paludibacteraceae bacterium]
MNFLRLIKRFIPPYKKELTLNIFFHLLSTLLSLVSFAAIIPILQILFGVHTETLIFQTVDWSASVGEITGMLKNNLFCWIQQQTLTQGAGWVLFALGIFLIVTTFLKTATSYLGSYFMIPIRTGVLRDLRSGLYNKIIHLPIGFFTEERKGDVMSRMTSDVAEVEASIMASLDMMFKNPIMIIIYLTTMLLLSWHLTLFVFLLLPVSGYLIGRIGKSLKTKSMRGQEQTGELLNQIEETLGGLRVVKAFNAEKKLISRFQTQNDNTRHTFNRINRRYAMAHPVSEFLGTAVIAALLWYG